MLLASFGYYVQVTALILENTFTSILDMAGVLLPFLKWFIGKSTSKGPKILNFLVRSPWNTIDVVGEVRLSSALLLIVILDWRILEHKDEMQLVFISQTSKTVC